MHHSFVPSPDSSLSCLSTPWVRCFADKCCALRVGTSPLNCCPSPLVLLTSHTGRVRQEKGSDSAHTQCWGLMWVSAVRQRVFHAALLSHLVVGNGTFHLQMLRLVKRKDNPNKPGTVL